MEFNHTQILALIIFLITFVLIISEKFHRTIVAILGASAVVITGLIHQSEAFEEFIDFNTLGLLIGMMIIVEIARDSGIFEYLAIIMVKLSKGKPMLVFIYFALLTAFLSAILDNVTTVLLIAPITFLVTDILKVNIYPFLMAEIFASNIGGTATLIGDPPNILIGSINHIPFNAFLNNLGPVSFITMIIMVFLLYFRNKRHLREKPHLREKIDSFNPTDAIKDKKLLIKSVSVIFVTLIFFLLHDVLHIMPATIALGGAAVLMLISIHDPEEFLAKIEWNTIFFFAGLFVVVAGLEKTGLIHITGLHVLKMTKDPFILTMIILWSSSILVSIISSVPLVITMIPVINVIISNLHMTKTESMPLWWALALGACLGGNGTIFASAANLVVAGVAEKYRPGIITFKKFLKEGFMITLISIVISSIYLYLRFFY